MNACEHDKIQGWEACPACDAARLRSDLSEAIGVLRESEWTDLGGGLACPWCGSGRGDGHAFDCRLAALLARHPVKP